ncbi:MAG: prephenate dehydrogenase/arogenate dehydrogenase family protein, partial [Alphaproteobacteria bacterium]|nr:prephenate dehydrogenase/arogenate dehydrogenase family protein [Alphaproteobacteria bacterium]
MLTPLPGTDDKAIAKVSDLWSAMGSMIETMDPSHHDQVLAV